MTPINFFINHRNLKIAYMTRKQVNGKSLPPAIVFLSGYRSNMRGTKASYINNLAENICFDYLRFDYSGHGESEGIFTELTLSDWIQDTYDIINYVFGNERPIILIGSSMGAWIAIKMFEKLKNPITHFIGLAPAADFTSILMKEQRALTDFKHQITTKGYVEIQCDYAGENFIITEKFLRDGDNNSVLDKPINFNGFVHIIQGMQDSEVPYGHALLLAQKITSDNIKIEFLKSSKHNLSEPDELLCLKNVIVNVLL